MPRKHTVGDTVAGVWSRQNRIRPVQTARAAGENSTDSELTSCSKIKHNLIVKVRYCKLSKSQFKHRFFTAMIIMKVAKMSANGKQHVN